MASASIQFENLVIDRPLYGVFRNKNNEVLGSLNQIQNLSISTSSETKDKMDAAGTLVKRFYTSKSVEISAENALFSLSLLGIQTATGKEVADGDNKIELPMIKKFRGDSTITLDVAAIDGTVSVYGLTADGLVDITKKYAPAAEAGAGTYTISIQENANKTVIAPPTDATDYIQVVLKYRSATAVRVLQRGDKFPDECEFILNLLVSDACDKETKRLAYIDFPSFQMSPDFDITMDTDSAHPFSGVAAVDYCSPDKSLFYIAISEEDTEE